MMLQSRRVRREKIPTRPLEQSVFLDFVCGGDCDSADPPMISQIVIGIVIAWFIIKGIERLADLLSGNDDAESTTPGKPESGQQS